MHVHFKFMLLLLHAAMLQKQERNIQKHKFMLRCVYQEESKSIF